MSNRQVKKLKYEFKNGARFSVSAEVAGAELERIHKANGALNAEDVVEESKPEEAPLHPAFEWDDEQAAEKYRNYQARTLIRAVHVVETKGETKTATRVYVHVPEEAVNEDGNADAIKSGYQPISVVVKRPDMYAAALFELQRKFNSARESLEQLHDAAKTAPDTDKERMVRIAIAVQAMQTASAAVSALH